MTECKFCLADLEDGDYCGDDCRDQYENLFGDATTLEAVAEAEDAAEDAEGQLSCI